jgi:hypothetical protein
MAHFMAHTTAHASPEQVLRVLTDPDEIRSWSPVPFEVEDLDRPRLEPGSVARVSGCLAGKRLDFDVEVHAADTRRLELTAKGPISFDVLYRLDPIEDRSDVTASIRLRDGSGLGGRLLAKATAALLRGGALDAAATRIARAAESASYPVAASPVG